MGHTVVISIFLGAILIGSMVVVVAASFSLTGWFEIGVPVSDGSIFHRGLTQSELVGALIIGAVVAIIALAMLFKLHAIEG